MSKINWDKHETDMWGYHCESWCKECVKDQVYCPACESYYGAGQWHGVGKDSECEKRLKALLAKQLSFPFMNE